MNPSRQNGSEFLKSPQGGSQPEGESDQVEQRFEQGKKKSFRGAWRGLLTVAGVVSSVALIVFLVSEILAIPMVQSLFQATELAEPGRPCQFRPGQSPEVMIIPAGSFTMGSPETQLQRESDERQHEVRVAQFAMGRCELSFAEYDAFANATERALPDDEGWGRGQRPVINVSWQDAMEYAAWLSEQTNESWRLPTEAEWEYATRAKTRGPFWWGDTISPEQANYDGNFIYNEGAKGVYRAQTLPVGSFGSNPFGLYDVHGNVWEWTCSEYVEEYDGQEQRCSQQDRDAGQRVLRGGSWFNIPWRLRSAFRNRSDPDERYNNTGFRLARAIP